MFESSFRAALGTVVGMALCAAQVMDRAILKLRKEMDELREENALHKRKLKAQAARLQKERQETQAMAQKHKEATQKVELLESVGTAHQVLCASGAPDAR